MKTLREKLTTAALENVEATGINPSEDLESLIAGETVESLLARCLNQADPEYIQGWREYVETLEAEASRQIAEGD